MKIFAAANEDAHQGWVWLQESNLAPRSVVKITHAVTKKSIYCEALQLDENFLKNYNQAPRIPITDPSNTLVIGAWYRASLGGFATQQEVDLVVKPCNSWAGQFKACIHHPQTVVRVAAWLGFIGLILGVVGLALGVISLLPSKT